MVTQVNFKIDSKLKDTAAKKAKSDGLSLSAVLKMMTKGYIEGRIDMSATELYEPNDATKKELSQALKEIRYKKNLSPKFSNAKRAIAYLKNG